MAKRSYSDEDRATALAALDANGGNLSRTASEMGVPRTTLQEWAAGRVAERVTDIRQEKKGALADRLEEIAHTLVDAIPNKVSDADLREVSTSLGITIDKMRLLREQPTAITANLTDDERAERVAALLDRARARRDGQPALRAV
jgi:transposase-like protein